MSSSIKKSPEESRNRLNEITNDLFRSVVKYDKISLIWIVIILLLIALCLGAWVIQLRNGMGVTGMRDTISWGLYISNFVFFVAISLIGFLISSAMHLLNIKWVKPISRIAEQIAIAGVALAGVVIVMDMGRPDRLLNVFLHGRFASPIIWDVTVIMTYLTISVLLIYLPLLPDIALMRDRLEGKVPKMQHKLYKVLSLGWKGNAKQYKTMTHGMRVLMILVMPVGLAIHTVTSWLFAATLRPGWDSTIFGPYFVTGAFVAGAAAVIVTMYVYRVRYGLKKYFTDYHFGQMGKLLVLVCLVYLYFNINEFLVPALKMKSADGEHLRQIFIGDYALLFWFSQIFGLFIPIILLSLKFFRKPFPIMLISVFVIIAAWVKRYIIVIPTLEHPFMPVQNVPENFHHYSPTTVEILITLFPFFAALLIMTILTKLFPVASIWEIAEHEDIDIEYLNEKPENN